MIIFNYYNYIHFYYIININSKMEENDEKETYNSIVPSIDSEIKMKDDNDKIKQNEENQVIENENNNQIKANEDNNQIKSNYEDNNIKENEDNNIKENEDINQNKIKEENNINILDEENNIINTNDDNNLNKINEDNNIILANKDNIQNKIKEENNINMLDEENNIINTNADYNLNKINEDNNIIQANEEKLKNQILENNTKIKTSSKIYIDKTSKLNGKTIYHIKGDFLEKNEEIVRRYRDFDLLHIKLSQNWPGIFIPPIAQKKYFGSLDPQTIKERIYQLENFLKISINSEYLINTEELKIFLNKNILNSDDFFTEIKKLNAYTLKQISENYTKYFDKYKNLKKQDFTEEQINTCIEFIDKFNLKLNIYKEQLVEYGEIKKTHIFRESRIASHFTEFEKYCMMEFTDNDLSYLFFFNGSVPLFEIKKKYKQLIQNPYLTLSCWLRLKELELISMKNNLNEFKALLSKKVSIENKQKDISQKLKDVEEGRISFLDKIMLRGDPQTLKEKYKNELDIQNNEVIYINNIVNILNAYLSIEVYKYFDDLKASFYKTVKKFAIIQRENCILASDLWLKVKCKNREENENEDINDIFDILDENPENEQNNTKNENNENEE